jgi:predicted ATPase
MDLDIQIENFKSVRSTRLPLRTGLNILIGPNGSGKTCLLSALKFIGDLLPLGAAEALSRSGGAKRVYHRGQSKIRFAVVQDYGKRTFNGEKCPFSIVWEVQIAQRGREKIATLILETFRILADVRGKKHTVVGMKIDRTHEERVSRQVQICQPDRLGINLFDGALQYGGGGRSKMRKDVVQELARWADRVKSSRDISVLRVLARADSRIAQLYERFISLDEYSILPEVARRPTEQLQFARMRPDGGAVSEVIHALENKHFDKLVPLGRHMPERLFYSVPSEYMYEYRSFYRHWLKVRHARRRGEAKVEGVLDDINRELARAVRPIDSVGVEIEPTTGRRGLIFRAGKEKFYPEEVSDGTMKWLCILASILVGHSNVYLLEEPENFLHPWMQQKLVTIMREEAQRTGTIFILASHSSTILNAARPEEVLVVHQSEKGTEVSEIVDSHEIETVLAESDFRLGDLWVSGAIKGTPADE